MTVENLLHSCEVAIWKRDKPALSKHRLYHERGNISACLVLDHVLHCISASQSTGLWLQFHGTTVAIGSRGEGHSWHIWAATSLANHVSCYRERAVGPPMEGHLQRNYFTFASGNLRETQRTLDCFRTRITEEGFLEL